MNTTTNYEENTKKIIIENQFYFDSFWSEKGRDLFALSFTDRGDLKAEAGRIRDSGVKAYYINISLDLLYLVHEYLGIFLSDNQLFEGIGKSSVILKVPEIRACSFGVLKKDIENSEELPVFDEERRKLHYFMFGVITKFIMLHEFSHVVNGHTDLIYEYRYEKKEKPALIDIQTLEMNADACAIQDLFREYMQQINANTHIPKQLANEESMSYCLLFCHILAMAVTSEHFMTLEKLESSKHPNPFMRHMIALSTLSTNYLFDKPNEHENLMNVAVRVYKDFVKSHRKVIEDDNFEELEWTFAPNSVPYNYAVVIGKHWDNLRPRLEKYAMVTLPPMYNE